MLLPCRKRYEEIYFRSHLLSLDLALEREEEWHPTILTQIRVGGRLGGILTLCRDICPAVQ